LNRGNAAGLPQQIPKGGSRIALAGKGVRKTSPHLSTKNIEEIAIQRSGILAVLDSETGFSKEA